MKKFISHLVSLALVFVPTTAFIAAPAKAHQITGRAICYAHSPSAYGYGIAYNAPAACNRALYECSILTPDTEMCFITRWYWEIR